MKAKVLVIWLVFYLLGCFAGYVVPLQLVVYFGIGLALILLAFLFVQKPYLFGVIFGFGLLFLSIWHFQVSATSLVNANVAYSGKKVDLQLRVDDLPQKALHGEQVRLVVVAGPNSLVGKGMTGYFGSVAVPNFGEIISASGKISAYKPETQWRSISTGIVGGISFSDYHVVGSNRSLLVVLHGYLLACRQAFNESVARVLPDAEAGLASGIVLGEKALISPAMIRALQVSGTTHIIALSGYNVTVILGLFILVRNRWSRWANLLVPMGLIILFTVMTGGAPSLVRAAIMGSLPLLARFLGRESDNFISILLSATLMSVFNPFLPLFDVGFQLSFIAFAGIVYISPLIRAAFGRLKFGFSEIFAETLGAQTATLPLLSYYFGMISVIAPLTNMIILGILPTCMALVFITGMAGMIWQPLGAFCAVPTYYLLHFVNSVISWSGSIGWASVQYKIENPWWILLFYLGLIDIWFIFTKVRRTRPTE